MTIGEKIKMARKAKKLTQPAFASLLGKSVRMIQKYENNEVIPSIEQIERIAIVLETTPFQLMGTDYWDMKFPNQQRQVDAIEGLVALLADVYGHVELKWVESENASSCYYLVGKGETTFILHEVDVDSLVELAKESIKPLVERIKDTRTENEVIDEIMADLNSQELKDKIKAFEERQKPPK